MVCAGMKEILLLTLMVTGGLGGRANDKRPASAHPANREPRPSLINPKPGKERPHSAPPRGRQDPLPHPKPSVLAEIIEYIQRQYQPHVQFAAAINVPTRFCETFDNNFLSEESDSNTVKGKLRTEYLYQGPELIVATPEGVGTGASAVHSERKLLMCEDNNRGGTPMKNLLEGDKDGCAVFYTYNSPCLDYCLNQAKDDNEVNNERVKNQRNQKNIEYNERNPGKPPKKIIQVEPAVQKCILKSLDMIANHKGLKAFVFSKAYEKDLDKQKLATELTKVAKKVPLFKCSRGSCVQCLIGNTFNNRCLSN